LNFFFKFIILNIVTYIYTGLFYPKLLISRTYLLRTFYASDFYTRTFLPRFTMNIENNTPLIIFCTELILMIILSFFSILPDYLSLTTLSLHFSTFPNSTLILQQMIQEKFEQIFWKVYFDYFRRLNYWSEVSKIELWYFYTVWSTKHAHPHFPL